MSGRLERFEPIRPGVAEYIERMMGRMMGISRQRSCAKCATDITPTNDGQGRRTFPKLVELMTLEMELCDPCVAVLQDMLNENGFLREAKTAPTGVSIEFHGCAQHNGTMLSLFSNAMDTLYAEVSLGMHTPLAVEILKRPTLQQYKVTIIVSPVED